MRGAKTYGQFCPVAMSAEILCKRWTLLIVRELLGGPLGFNEILRGVPLMSRTLLSARLSELEAAGLLRRRPPGPGARAAYRLTEAGRALRPTVKALGDWGQEWIEPDLRAGDVEYGHLLRSLRRSATRTPDMPERFLVRFEFLDAPEGNRLRWLVLDGPDIDICHADPGGEVHVWIACRLAAFAELWMGWRSLPDAVRDGAFAIDGPPRFVEDPFRWLGRSVHADVAKRPPAERVRRG